jgi:hypothetical protein
VRKGGVFKVGKGVGVRGQNKEAKWEKKSYPAILGRSADGPEVVGFRILTFSRWKRTPMWAMWRKKKIPFRLPPPHKICKKNFNLASLSIIRFLWYHVWNIYIWEIRGPKLGPKTEYISAWFSAILSNFWEFKANRIPTTLQKIWPHMGTFFFLRKRGNHHRVFFVLEGGGVWLGGWI